MKRIVIKWENVNQIECSGNVTLDEWTDDQTFIDKPWRTTSAGVDVGKGRVGMRNFSRAIFTDEIVDAIYDMAHHFFAGVTNNDSIYRWLDLKKNDE